MRFAPVKGAKKEVLLEMDPFGDPLSITLGGIAAGIASVRGGTTPESSRGRRKCKRTKRKRDENGSGPETENGEK
jgi:hypothetical protein